MKQKIINIYIRYDIILIIIMVANILLCKLFSKAEQQDHDK